MRGVRERERQRTTPLLKGLTWRKKAATHSHTRVPPRTQTPIKLPTTYGTDERLAYRRGQTNTARTHTRMLTAVLKIKTNQCLMLQILRVRKEESGRMEREGEE